MLIAPNKHTWAILSHKSVKVGFGYRTTGIATPTNRAGFYLGGLDICYGSIVRQILLIGVFINLKNCFSHVAITSIDA